LRGVSKTAAYNPVLDMTLPQKHTRAGRATVIRIDAITQACRPMADYLFGEALGAPPSEDLLRSAKDALLPLRGHPGRIGEAVIVLLEGGESQTDYDDAVSVLLHTARGGKGGVSDRSGEWAHDRESAPAVIAMLPSPSGVQLTFLGLDD
jgi:hypothetical protein